MFGIGIYGRNYMKKISAKEKEYEKHVRNSDQKWSQNHEKSSSEAPKIMKSHEK